MFPHSLTHTPARHHFFHHLLHSGNTLAWLYTRAGHRAEEFPAMQCSAVFLLDNRSGRLPRAGQTGLPRSLQRHLVCPLWTGHKLLQQCPTDVPRDGFLVLPGVSTCLCSTPRISADRMEQSPQCGNWPDTRRGNVSDLWKDSMTIGNEI